MKDWNGFDELKEYVGKRLAEFGEIDTRRREILDAMAASVRDSDNGVQLVFICTHNSRRSHMAHLWAELAAWHCDKGEIRCYSGGTEATAFNPLAVKAMRESGFSIRTRIPGSNPVYQVAHPGTEEEIRVFSKKYTDPPNPVKGFTAVMTCSEADEACPVVIGASARFSLPYEDPKEHDGTPGETEAYADRCRQIAREMLYLFSRV